jgi:hypothetical protein
MQYYHVIEEITMGLIDLAVRVGAAWLGWYFFAAMQYRADHYSLTTRVLGFAGAAASLVYPVASLAPLLFFLFG